MMEKANVSGLVRPDVVTDSKVFEDPSQPGFQLPVTLTSLLGPGRMDAALRGQQYIQRYVTPAKGTEKLILLLPDGKPWDATELGCRNIAQLEERQKALPAAQRYSDVEWAHVNQCMADAWNDVLEFSAELDDRMKARNLSGNPSGLPTQPASGTQPGSTESTPNSPSEETLPSAPSTSDPLQSTGGSAPSLPSPFAPSAPTTQIQGTTGPAPTLNH